MQVAVGEVYFGVFSTSDSLWDELYVAGEHEFDRFWPMPLDEESSPLIYKSNADLQNVRKLRQAIPWPPNDCS